MNSNTELRPATTQPVHRSLRYYLPSYMRTMSTFRNGLELVRAHYTYDHWVRPQRAVFWDGQQLYNVDHRPGFADTIVELWGLEAYTPNGFYTPADGDVVLDLGANIGLFSVWIARRAPNARVVALELSSENYETAQMNLADYGKNVEVHHAAVGRTTGSGRLIAVGERTLDHRLLVTDDAGGSEKVNVMSLEDATALCEASMIDFVKMDIEGSEVDVFEGASPALLKRFRRIALEFHDNIRPGSRVRLEQLLAKTHRIISVDEGEYGILRAVLNGHVRG